MKHKRTNIVIVIMGLSFVTAYILKIGVENAQVQDALSLLGAAAGVVTSVRLGFYAITLDDKFMGRLADKRISIFIGAFALMWVAAKSIFKILG